MPKVSIESDLPLVALSDPSQVIRIPQVQFAENGCPLEQLKSRRKKWEWVFVLVYARAERLVFLLDKEKPRCYW